MGDRDHRLSPGVPIWDFIPTSSLYYSFPRFEKMSKIEQTGFARMTMLKGFARVSTQYPAKNPGQQQILLGRALVLE